MYCGAVADGSVILYQVKKMIEVSMKDLMERIK